METLRDFHNSISGIVYLWICGTGCPTGHDYNHDIDTDDDDDYCNIVEVIDSLNLWELTGEIVDSRWEWDGNGHPKDELRNTIYNIKAY